jgi:peptide/nickel transport system substrate-binding protein
MEEETHSIFLKKRQLPFFQGISDYIQTRSAGDKFIFLILGILIATTSLIGFLKLQEKIMVVEPAYGGSIIEGDIGTPRFVNPLLALTTTDQDLTTLTYAGLMGLGPNNTLVPVLAQSYIISPDGKTYQFTLRNNVKFSDGTPITADDVVFTVQKAQDSALKSPQYANWAGVQAVALDPHTIQFTLSAPYAQFIYDTTLGILPAHLWRNITDAEFPFSPLETNPVGEGPFAVTNITRDSQGDITRFDLSANPNYALGRPYLDSYHFAFYEDQASLQTAFSKRQIDSAYGIKSRHTLTAPYSHLFAVFFGQSGSDALTKVTTREALSMAIDRNDIVQNVLGGYATPLNGPVPAGSGTEITSGNKYSDVQTAQSLLKKSGWIYATSTSSWKDTKGNELSVTLKTSNVPELKILAQKIQANWQKIGIKTTIQVYEPGDLAQNVISPRAFQALLFGMVIGKGGDLYDFWSSKERANPGLNITGYNNPAVDTLLTKFRSETDPLARAKELAQINNLIATDYPAAFIESPDFLYSVPTDLKGVILPQITAPSDRFATAASWYRRTVSVWPFLTRNK